MLSERSQVQWHQLTAGEDGRVAALDREALAPWLVGIHLRGEELSAHDLRGLLDELDLPDDERDGLVAYVEAALGLLATYDVALAFDDEDAPNVSAEGEAPPGWLVI